MRFKIKGAQEVVPEIEVELRLERDGEAVKLIAENNKGEKRNIMLFLNGKFTKIGYVDMRGLKQMEQGKLRK